MDAFEKSLRELSPQNILWENIRWLFKPFQRIGKDRKLPNWLAFIILNPKHDNEYFR